MRYFNLLNNCSVVIAVLLCAGENGVTTEAHSKKCFNFDAVLQPEVTQEEVFEEGMRPIIEHVLKGEPRSASHDIPFT